ncbi:MAG: hypothetical protein JO141_12755 [Bradyrhizobium sp.]|nr:hypothetical protein [Bradyrhizobium sp.]
MRIITLEEHFATPRFFDGPGKDLKEQAEKFNSPRALKLIPQLDAIRVRGFSASPTIACADRDPTSVADFVRATFFHQGRR